ncbi:MAG TPA: hypothetical protein VN975_07735 [Xanthobacteraceae bacterium]|jgi:hypothetical protein|nr:hypothetical protein [Xanthobacteraceae bacterium]
MTNSDISSIHVRSHWHFETRHVDPENNSASNGLPLGAVTAGCLPKFNVATASEITPLKNGQSASGTRRAHSPIGFCRFPNQFDQRRRTVRPVA